MRRLVIAAVIAAAAGGIGAAPASAVCDPHYRPLCLSPCLTKLPDPHNPEEIITRVCPA